MSLGRGGKCGKFFLILINTVFLLLGLALMVIGITMRVENDTLDKDEVITLLNKISFNGTLSLGNVANSLSILIICLGVFIMLVAVLGVFGACCRNKCMLVTYAIIVLLILVVQCVVVGLWFTMKDKTTTVISVICPLQVENVVQEKMTTLLNDYEGVTSTNEVSIGWNLVFLGFDCCGVDAISNTSNTDEFSGSKWWQIRNGTEAKVPQSCCIEATEENYQTYPYEEDCQQNLLYHHRKGCYQAFKDWLSKYQTAAIVVGVILLVIEVVAIVSAFVVYRVLGNVDSPVKNPGKLI